MNAENDFLKVTQTGGSHRNVVLKEMDKTIHATTGEILASEPTEGVFLDSDLRIVHAPPA